MHHPRKERRGYVGRIDSNRAALSPVVTACLLSLGCIQSHTALGRDAGSEVADTGSGTLEAGPGQLPSDAGRADRADPGETLTPDAAGTATPNAGFEPQPTRIPDEDRDGLPDDYEIATGTSPTDRDSDDDGAPDYLEALAQTDGTDPTDNPAARGDLVITPRSGHQNVVRFDSRERPVDLYLLLDIADSMSSELAAIRNAIPAGLVEFSCGSDATPCLQDWWLGVGVFPVGTTPDDQYRNLVSMSPDAVATLDAVGNELNPGAGFNESLFLSASCVATEGLCDSTSCAGHGVGCPGFRSDAHRFLIAISDDEERCENCRIFELHAASTLENEDIELVAIDASGSPTSDLRHLATERASRGSSGRPLYFEGEGDLAGPAVREALREIARLGFRAYRVVLESRTPAALEFFRPPNAATHIAACASGALADMDDDGISESIVHPRPATDVCFELPLAETLSDRGPPRAYVLDAVLEIDSAEVERRSVYLLLGD